MLHVNAEARITSFILALEGFHVNARCCRIPNADAMLQIEICSNDLGS
jgi:hypothetical protein